MQLTPVGVQGAVATRQGASSSVPPGTEESFHQQKPPEKSRFSSTYCLSLSALHLFLSGFIRLPNCSGDDVSESMLF